MIAHSSPARKLGIKPLEEQEHPSWLPAYMRHNADATARLLSLLASLDGVSRPILDMRLKKVLHLCGQIAPGRNVGNVDCGLDEKQLRDNLILLSRKRISPTTIWAITGFATALRKRIAK